MILKCTPTAGGLVKDINEWEDFLFDPQARQIKHCRHCCEVSVLPRRYIVETGLATCNTLLALTSSASSENNKDLIFLHIGYMPTILGKLSYPGSANVA